MTAIPWEMHAKKDYPLDASVVHKQWRLKKISTEVAIKDITYGRDLRASVYLRAIRESQLAEEALDLEAEQEKVQRMLLKTAKPFVMDPVVEDWVSLFHRQEDWGRKGRWKPLLFVGESTCGKSWKAMSLFPNVTLKVSCNGTPHGCMPSLKGFRRRKHKALFFDEIRPDIVLAWRELYQSGPYRQQLGVSQCGQHEYSVWTYGLPLILAANSFEMKQNSPQAKSDWEWLEMNVLMVHVPPHGKWYHDEAVVAMEDSAVVAIADTP